MFKKQNELDSLVNLGITILPMPYFQMKNASGK